MDFLWTILGVVVLAIVITLIIYGERSITSHWVFWVGIALLVATFVGVPVSIYGATRYLKL